LNENIFSLFETLGVSSGSTKTASNSSQCVSPTNSSSEISSTYGFGREKSTNSSDTNNNNQSNSKLNNTIVVAPPPPTKLPQMNSLTGLKSKSSKMINPSKIQTPNSVNSVVVTAPVAKQISQATTISSSKIQGSNKQLTASNNATQVQVESNTSNSSRLVK